MWEPPRNHCTILSAFSGYCKGEGGIGIASALALTTTFDAEIMIAEFRRFYTRPCMMCDRYHRL